MTDTNIYKFFLEKATALDVQRFCETNGYYLEIINNTLGHEKMVLVKGERGENL